MDRCWWTKRAEWTLTNVEWNEDEHQMKQRWTLNGTMMDIRWNGNKHWTKSQWTLDRTIQNEANKMEWTMTTMDCVSNNIREQSASANSAMMTCWKEEFFFFLPLCVFFLIIFFFFFFQSYYKGYSFHDCKLKNTHKCTAQMLTSKPMYKQMYVGLHHLMQILYYNQTLCVCVHVPKT
jgi:ATP-dependent Zn protease